MTVFYVISAGVMLALGLTVWIAVVLKKDENGGVWLKRWVEHHAQLQSALPFLSHTCTCCFSSHDAVFPWLGS